MQKRVFIVHGWGGKPNSNWFPWLKKELGAKTIIEHAKGHFTDGDNITELPIALKSLLEIAEV